jgi:protocatechuate 3,4-dioxygenase beta subunit
MAITRRRLVQVALASAVISPLTGPSFAQSQTPAPPPSNTARLWKKGDPGERKNLRGRIVDAAGLPIAGARVQMRQADGTATYTEQYAGLMVTQADGSYRLATVVRGQ